MTKIYRALFSDYHAGSLLPDPPDSMDQRLNAAQEAICAYWQRLNLSLPPEDERDAKMADMLTDMLHWFRLNGISPSGVLAHAPRKYRDETCDRCGVTDPACDSHYGAHASVCPSCHQKPTKGRSAESRRIAACAAGKRPAPYTCEEIGPDDLEHEEMGYEISDQMIAAYRVTVPAEPHPEIGELMIFLDGTTAFAWRGRADYGDLGYDEDEWAGQLENGEVKGNCVTVTRRDGRGQLTIKLPV
jgi:hypothetical protein